jgi:hypothetical protein
VAATQQTVSAAEVLARVREISDALTEAARLVDEATAKTAALALGVFDGGHAMLPRFETAVDALLSILAHNLGVELGDGITGDFQLDDVARDARELVALTAIAAKGDDDGC